MESYFPVKLKRKDLDEVNDDFCDFSLSSPARKIRRLDAELPPIIEEDEMANPAVFGQPIPAEDAFVEQIVRSSPIPVDKLNGSLPENQERAIVLYDPMNNMPSLQSRSPFSISVNSEFLSGFKNSVLWSNGSDLLESLDGKTENQNENSEPNNRSLAMVPWVPMHSQCQGKQEMQAPQTAVYEMMDADDIEATTMDVEDDNNFQQMAVSEFGSVNASDVNQWQQHCMIPQPPHNLSAPISWSGTGV